MKRLNMCFLFVFIIGLLGCGEDDNESVTADQVTCAPSEINIGYEATSATTEVVASREWTAYSNNDWISCAPASSIEKTGTVTLHISANPNSSVRQGFVVVKAGSSRDTVFISQAAKPKAPVDPNIVVPEGYKLVWHDEFDSGTAPGADWWYETGGHGWGNNELQHYVAGSQGSEQLATVKDGTLAITAKKIGDTVYSIRMNTVQSWKYGYFEARLKLPSGKGTWPAFWMMPKNFTAWPDDGEIDIMEEVGYRPNYVSSAIHCKAYNHTIGTQKTRETYLLTAQTEFHVYALEWTADYIRTYVDGKELFYFPNDQKGDKTTWPFDAAFYLKLNLAWGGNWGGAEGVDESVLPATYEIDYVRVFQKK